MTTKTKEALGALAYKAAQSQVLAPQAILIRPDILENNGQVVKAPNGQNGTFVFKESTQDQTGFHTTKYRYTTGSGDLKLTAVKPTPEKENTANKRNQKDVWPLEKQLEEFFYNPIAHSQVAST